MAAKSWNEDFRIAAIKESIRLVGEDYADDPFQFPGSFCIPVADKPVIGWTPGRVFLITLILGFVLLGAGAVLGTRAEKNQHAVARNGLMVFAVCSSLSGIAIFFLPLVCDRHLVGWMIGERGRNLVDRAGMATIMTAELSDADPSRMKLSIDGDDYVLIFPDEANCRVMIEGIGARYQIRAEDVEQLLRFEFLNYLGVEIVCRIGAETRMRIAIARVSILLEVTRQLPIFHFLRKWISNKLFERFSLVLGVPHEVLEVRGQERIDPPGQARRG